MLSRCHKIKFLNKSCENILVLVCVCASVCMCLCMCAHHTIRGSGHPVTVQCSRTHCFSHTVCERGLITNSGECIRLSSFRRLWYSSLSWIYKHVVTHSLHILIKLCFITNQNVNVYTMLFKLSLPVLLSMHHPYSHVLQTWHSKQRKSFGNHHACLLPVYLQ